MWRCWRLPLALCAFFTGSVALASPLGDADYVLFLEYENRIESPEGESRSRSSGRQALAERIVSQSADGTEIEYFLPTGKDRIRGNEMWMFPARVFVSSAGNKRILNGEELQARVDDWIERAEWTREVCGRWLFTWTAIQIRCDNDAAIGAIETFGMRPARMAPGESIALGSGARSTVLIDNGSRGGMRILSATAAIDPHLVREEQREAAYAIAEMSGEETSADTVEAEVSQIDASGTITVEFDVDKDGLVWKRSAKMEVTLTGLNYGDETRIASRTVTRMTRDQWAAHKAGSLPSSH